MKRVTAIVLVIGLLAVTPALAETYCTTTCFRGTCTTTCNNGSGWGKLGAAIRKMITKQSRQGNE